MITAMQKLINELKHIENNTGSSQAIQIQLAITLRDNEEKQQIIDAANQDEFADFGGVSKGEIYFHNTYTNKK